MYHFRKNEWQLIYVVTRVRHVATTMEIPRSKPVFFHFFAT